MLRACIAGYEDRLFDSQVLAVHSGYWAGYYGNAKKPKSLSSVIKAMINKRSKATQHTSKHVDDVNVQAFLDKERSFKERVKKFGVKKR